MLQGEACKMYTEVPEIALPIKELTEEERYWQMKNNFHLLRENYEPALN